MISQSQRSLVALATWALLLAPSPGWKAAPAEPVTRAAPTSTARPVGQASSAASPALPYRTLVPPSGPATAGAAGFDLWTFASRWFLRLGVGGAVSLVFVYVFWRLLGQAQNIEAALRLLGIARKPPASDSPLQSKTTTDGNSYISTSTSKSPVTSSASISAGGNVQIGELHHHIHPPPQPKSELLSIPISSGLIASTEGPVATSHSKQDPNQPSEPTENRQSTIAGNPCPTNRDE